MQGNIWWIFLCLGLASPWMSLQARHLIGGTMSYECLGDNQYKFTLKVYRDCNCSECANLDDVASIGIYRCDADGSCPDQYQTSPWRSLDVPLQQMNTIEEPDYPCLIPPDVCGQEGIYEFTTNLPGSTMSYFVAYQRCCRNVTIDNLIAPEDHGATYAVEITPYAQTACNSSPSFDAYPPIIICNNAPLEYDHSATDPDGDLLIYEFCAPLVGGGPLLDQNAYNTCHGANPTPACPPPYDPVPFASPTYTPTRPMAGNPVIRIDDQTGLITGTPRFQGQFVVGVCVSEYRGGFLLSRIYRDFQFNVANCEPTVIADIQEDEQRGLRQFVINSCGNNSVTFVNESFQRSFIDKIHWTFDLGNNQQYQTEEWSPTVDFPGVGQYQGQLVLNENTQCGDTADIFVNVFPAIEADFHYAYDTCIAGPVLFTDMSSTGACCLTDWQWQFGDGNSSNEQHPVHTYDIPGQLPVSLQVTDANKCTALATKSLPYFPAPAYIVVAPSAELECVPADIFFNNLSTPVDSTYGIHWDFGDGGSSSAVSPIHTYADPGTFTVSLDITSPIGCQIDTTFERLITMLPSPYAGFTYSPETPSSLQPEVQFTDQSEGAIHWQWQFGQSGLGSNLPSPLFHFPDTGIYHVQQVVTHPSGCRDTSWAIIDIFPDIRYYLPNAFTPNGDGHNDTFKGKGVTKGVQAFELTIWNRWGEPMFRTNNSLEGWDGRKHNQGANAPGGVYLVTVYYETPRGEQVELKGYATLIR